MIRPRTGDFLYSDDEIEVMLEDIRVFKQNNVSGVVLGALKAEGRVDVEVTQRYVQSFNLECLIPAHDEGLLTRHCPCKVSASQPIYSSKLTVYL